MTPFQNARARQHTYTLFSQLFLHGITADLLPYLQSVPDLAAVLPQPFDPDETAAAHHNLLSFNIFPNASIFLAPSRLLGGPVANEYDDLYRQSGFVPDSAADPDHLSQALAYLAYLLEGEANQLALASGQSAITLQSRQYHFLENYLLLWFLPCAIAIQQQNDPFYSQLTHLTLALLADHLAVTRSTNQPAASFTAINESTQLPITNYPITPLPYYPIPTLQDNQTGLREIARFLITPIRSGLYLGRSDINRLARRLNLPHGFGSRDQMLQTLLQSAGQYETAPQLFAAMHDLLTTWQEGYQQIGRDHVETAVHISPWQTRLHQTRKLLTQMEEQLT
jgi:TorA maturation chaperone TorD